MRILRFPAKTRIFRDLNIALFSHDILKFRTEYCRMIPAGIRRVWVRLEFSSSVHVLYTNLFRVGKFSERRLIATHKTHILFDNNLLNIICDVKRSQWVD